jgi:hypothetical protein
LRSLKARRAFSGNDGALERFQAKHALGLDPGVATGSRQENASDQESRASVSIPRNGKGSGRQSGAEAMSLSMLKVVLWIFEIRGRIPQNDDFRGDRNESSLAADFSPLARILAAFALAVVSLSLVLWAAVWLAIKLL